MKITGDTLIKNSRVTALGDQFKNIIDVDGELQLRCVDFFVEAVLDTAYNLLATASNAELILSGCAIENTPAHNWDIFLNAAVANATIRIQDSILDDTKLSLAGAGGTDAIGAFISNAIGGSRRFYLGKNYTPANLANWSGVDPVDMWTALDRIAALIGPIP